MQPKTPYELEWDAYSQRWDPGSIETPRERVYLGDEWGSGHMRRYTLFIRPYLDHDSTVLEIGPGGGRLTELLLRDCAQVVGLDVSASMLARLRERFGELPGLRLVKGNGMDLSPVEDGSVDCVVSYDVFVHLEPEDIYAYLIEMRRVLRAGGTGIVHFANVLSGPGFERFRQTYAEGRGGRRHAAKFSCMTLEIMTHFVESLGLRVLLADAERFHPRDALVVFEAPAS